MVQQNENEHFLIGCEKHLQQRIDSLSLAVDNINPVEIYNMVIWAELKKL